MIRSRRFNELVLVKPMANSARLFGTNGIRGVYGTDITEEDFFRLGKSIGLHYGERSTCVVGSDYRQTSDSLKSSLISGLSSIGVSVMDVGYTPTPGLQYFTKRSDTDFGVVVTASHNPPEFNGIKLIDGDGIEVDKEVEMNVERLFRSSPIRRKWTEVGRVYKGEALLSQYIDEIRSHVDVPSIRKRTLTVVVDAGNGVGGLVTPKLLSKIGVKSISLNANLDGRFPSRLSEPLPENLGVLQEMVREYNADFGVAHDGDADRAIFCTSEGNFQFGDRTVALIAKWWYEQSGEAKIVTPINTSKLIDDVTNEHNGEVVRTKVGSITVSRTMVREKIRLGGEENGGIFFGPHQPVRDGPMAVALIAQILTTYEESLSSLLNAFPYYSQVKEKLDCPSDKTEFVLDEIKSYYNDYPIIDIDGIKVEREDGWVLIRPSGTEPIIRCFSESSSAKKAKQYNEEALHALKDIRDSV